MRGLLAQTVALVVKDLRVELRTREVVTTAALFSLVLVTLFVFSGFESRATASLAAPGVLWVSLAFVGTIVFGRTFQRERDEGAIAGLLLVPGIVGPLFVAKLILNVGLMCAVELLLVPAVCVTFRVTVADPLQATLALAAGTLGFATLGTVLAAALASVKLREVLLPIVLFPLAIPLLVAGVRATDHAIAGDPAWGWLALMGAFDAAFLALSSWLFAEVVDGS